MNPLTGEIRTKKFLAGKGRPDPYSLRLRGTDGGGLHGDTELSLYIGDVSANDGVPLFIKPTLDQVASISEVSTNVIIRNYNKLIVNSIEKFILECNDWIYCIPSSS